MTPSSGFSLLVLTVVGISWINVGQCAIVDIKQLGSVEGSESLTARTGQTIYNFYNIPYAEPPTGSRRFKAPEPVAPWSPNVLNVTVAGRSCPQLGITELLPPSELASSSLEDCLTLSVFTKNMLAKAPVMVYIHGGSFYLGKASDHPPDYLLEKDVVLVVIQYRLGALGFLSTMTDAIPGNAAMLDMVAALAWVQQHIEDFGGDREKVTIFGQSAGAAAASALMYSPLVPEAYFRNVILQSGAVSAAWVIDPNPVENAMDIARIAGCNIQLPLRDVEECLMAMPTLTLLVALNTHVQTRMITHGLGNMGGCGIVVGGPSQFFQELPYQAVANGKIRPNTRLMAGATKHDGSYMMATIYDVLAAMGVVNNTQFNQYDLVDIVNRMMGLDDHSGSLAGYEIETLFNEDELRSGNFSHLINGLIDITGTMLFKGPVLRDVQARIKLGQQGSYLYAFDYIGEHTRFGYGASTAHYPFPGGVHHSNDNIYLFPYPSEVSKLNAADTRMSEKMVDLWTSFAINGEPRSEGMPQWLPAEGVTGPYMHINTDSNMASNYYDEFATSVHRTGDGSKITSSWYTVAILTAAAYFTRAASV